MLNPYFLNNSKQEQNLIQSLVNEQLKMYGIEIYYIPRRYVKKNTVIREVIQSEFDNAYPIEAYLDSYEGYGGQGTILSKFGIEEQDDLTLVVSKDRYENYISPLIKNIPNIELATRPKEGDLIYFPLGDRLFEINYVEHEQPFYQLQKNYVYTLKCQLYRYEDEVLDTGVETIDDEIEQIGYIQKLQLIGVATPATASIAGICSGAISGINITNMGGGYTSHPTVAISSAPAGGVDAEAVAVLTSDYIGCDGTKGGTVTAIHLTNPGCGYTVNPIITITGGGGGGATAEVVGIETIGGIHPITVTSGGSGYVGAPTVGISTPKHVGALGTANLDSPIVGGGVSVISANVTLGVATYLFPGGVFGGAFYKEAPPVVFDLPTGSGNNAQATTTLDSIAETGGTVETIGLTTGGKFYTSVPGVTLTHPGTSFASATIGIAGSSINPSSIAFSTTGRAYRTAPTVAITTSGTMIAPTVTAIGIATIHPITGIVTAVSFNNDDAWAVGTSATIGAGYTVAPTISFSGSPSPIQATASVTVSVAGTVSSISIGNSGYGYITAPTVTIGGPGGGNEQFRALGFTTIRFNSISTTGTLSTTSTTITGITTTNIVVGDRVRLAVGHDKFYNFVKGGTFVSGIGAGSITLNKASTNVGIATSVFEFGIDQCGIVTGIGVTYGGGGYLSPPVVTISNDSRYKNYIDVQPGVTTAIGVANTSAAGVVTSVTITNSGSQYVLTPTITISEPVSTSTGSFIFNEVVTGATSGTTARVKSYDAANNILEVSIVDGTFTPGETIVGSESGARHSMKTQDKFDTVDPFADNDTIELRADDIIDFSKTNPFGMP